jgi:hypothetical protein
VRFLVHIAKRELSRKAIAVYRFINISLPIGVWVWASKVWGEYEYFNRYPEGPAFPVMCRRRLKSPSSPPGDSIIRVPQF